MLHSRQHTNDNARYRERGEKPGFCRYSQLLEVGLQIKVEKMGGKIVK